MIRPGLTSITVLPRIMKKPACRQIPILHTQYSKCELNILLQKNKLLLHFRWERGCENTRQYLEKLPVYLDSPISELSGSFNSSYVSSAVGTKYHLKCPHGKFQEPRTNQILTCLPNRQIALDPPDLKECLGNYKCIVLE